MPIELSEDCYCSVPIPNGYISAAAAAAALSAPSALSHIASDMLNILSVELILFYQPGKLPAARLLSASLLTVVVRHDSVVGATLYRKNPHIRTLNFEGRAAVGSYLVITISIIKLLGN